MNAIELVREAQKGDKMSFMSLIQAKKEQIYRIAYSYSKNEEDALDIIQEATYKAYISINKLKKPEYFNTWLIRIVINCAIDYTKKKKTIVYLDDNFIYEPNAETKDTEAIIDLYNALDNLDINHRIIVLLKFFEDLTFNEIAQILKLPESTVKSYYYRAIERLKVELKGDS